MQIKKPEFIKIAMVFSCILLLNDAVMHNSKTEKPSPRYLKGDEHPHRCDENHIRHNRHKKIGTKECIAVGPSSIFLTKNLTVITAQTGSTAVLPCMLMGFVNGVVSWKRLVDNGVPVLLTVGSTRIHRADHFLPEQVKSPTLQFWRLLIPLVKHSDAGTYECQVSTDPPSYIHVHLITIDAYAVIYGSPELHIKNGSQMHLTCKLVQSTEEPSYVFWFHENTMINFDQYRGISTFTNRNGSTLTISTISHSHSGNYSCVPSNARPASILVHILDDEKPAAMHTDSRNFSPAVTKSSEMYEYSAFVIIVYSLLFSSCFFLL